MPSDKKLPGRYDAFRAAQERELDRILDDLEKQVDEDIGKLILDKLLRNTNE